MRRAAAALLLACLLPGPASSADAGRAGTIALALAQFEIYKKQCLAHSAAPIGVRQETALLADAASFRGTPDEAAFNEAYAYFRSGYAPIAASDPARFCNAVPSQFETWGYAGIVGG